MDLNSETGPAKAFSRFNAAVAQAGESQRALLQEIGQFTRDESLRFVTLRLERAGTLMDKLATGQGVGGLIAAQQEWLRDLIADYAAHNTRMAGAMRDIAHTMTAQAVEAAGATMTHMQQQADEAMHQTADAMEHAQAHGEAAVQDLEQHNPIAETQH